MLVNMMEAKTQLSKLVELAAHGERVVIANRGKPMVELVRVTQPSKRVLGTHRFELAEEFFEPLAEEDLQAWGL